MPSPITTFLDAVPVLSTTEAYAENLRGAMGPQFGESNGSMPLLWVPPSLAKYPTELAKPGPFEKWVEFRAMSGRHIGRVGMSERGRPDSPVARVQLYLPEEALRTEINAAYDQTDIGAFTGALSEFTAQTDGNYMGNMAKSIDNMANSTVDALVNGDASMTATLETLTTAGAGAWDGIKSLAREIGQAATTDGGNMLSQAMFASILNKASSVAPGAAAQITGARVNPRTDVLFNHMEYRTHDFEYLLIPRTEAEAEAIDKIIHMFQFYMLPSYSPNLNNNIAGTMIGFPYEFEIAFWSETQPLSHHINKIGRSVLTSVGIDHAAAGNVSFYKSTKPGAGVYPMATKLSLKFMEVTLLARDSDEINRGDMVPGTQEDSKADKGMFNENASSGSGRIYVELDYGPGTRNDPMDPGDRIGDRPVTRDYPAETGMAWRNPGG